MFSSASALLLGAEGCPKGGAPGFLLVWVQMETFVIKCHKSGSPSNVSFVSPQAVLCHLKEDQNLSLLPLLFTPQCLSPSSTPNHSISCHCISLHLTRKVQEEILLCHYLDEKWRFQQVYSSTKASNTRTNVTKDFVWEPRWLWWLPLIMIVFTNSIWKTTWIYFTDKKYTTSYCWVGCSKNIYSQSKLLLLVVASKRLSKVGAMVLTAIPQL